MRYILFYFAVILTLSGCYKIDSDEINDEGRANFSAISIEQFSNLNPQARILSNSAWRHIYPPEAEVVISSLSSGETHVLTINPNDFSQPQQIQLPYGEYRYEVRAEGRELEDYLPFEATGEFELNSESLNIILEGHTEYGLVTVKNELIGSVLINGEIELALTEEGGYFYKYVREGEEVQVEIVADIEDESFVREVEVGAYNHYHFYLRLAEDPKNVNFIELLLGEFEYEEDFFQIGDVENIVFDADGQAYRTVRIGNQVWMAENLKTTKYCNGDEIENLPGGDDWAGLDRGVWTYYDNDEQYNRRRGKLYSEAVVYDERGICPCGWSVPSNAEWEELIEFTGGPASLKISGNDYWESPFGGGTNESGFSAFPAGFFSYFEETPFSDSYLYNRYYQGGHFYSKSNMAGWWVDTTEEGLYTDFLDREYYRNNIGLRNSIGFNYIDGDVIGLSIRCIKDE